MSRLYARAPLYRRGGNYRAFVLNAETARIEHLTLTGFSGSDPGGGYGGTVRVTQGTVADCRFYDTGAASNTRGGALGLSGANAIAERCVISNCWTTLSSGGSQGGAMAITDGGRAENCLIFGCRSNGAGGVYISDGHLANCIVTDCYTSDGSKTLTGYAGGVCAEGSAKVYNSVIVGNRNGLDDVTSQVKGTESRFFNNAMAFAWGRNCVTDDPRFADALHGDWHIGKDSPLVNAGTNLIYTAESKDFEGNPRVFNFGRKSGKPDIGLYETPWGSPGMLLLVK